MKYLKLFENFDIHKTDIKEIFQYLDDDLDLTVTYETKVDELIIQIYKVAESTGIPRFRFNDPIKKIFDIFISYCNENELPFYITNSYNGRKVSMIYNNINDNGKIGYKLIRADYTNTYKEIKSCEDLQERWFNWCKIEVKLR